MADTHTAPNAGRSKVGANLERFRQALGCHDRENPTHNAYGIGLSHFDMQRLGFDDGETLWDGITVQTDGGQSGMCRVLCDGAHDGIEHAVRVAAGVEV
jgi:hypothetical protein